MKTMKMSNYEWVNKEDVVHTHNRMLFNYKKKWNLAICDVNGNDGSLQSQKDIYQKMWNIKKQSTASYNSDYTPDNYTYIILLYQIAFDLNKVIRNRNRHYFTD